MASALRVKVLGDTSNLAGSLKGAAGMIAGFAGAAAAAIGGLVISSVKRFIDFDEALNNSLAIMGDVSEALRKDMSDAAREIGKTTRFSATQAAEAYFFLASAGLDAKASIEALPRVANFATAGNFDLSTATDLLTDAQSALGLAVDDTAQNIKNMTRVSDVLVKANTLANASVQQFSEALTNKAGAAMRSLNMDIEEGVAVLSVFADQGIKGSEAGTTFNAVIRGLTDGVRRNSGVWKKHEIAVFDADGQMRSMADIVEDMEGALAGMSVEQQRNILSQLGFTEETLAGTLALMGNSDALREYEKDLRNAGGTTDEVANKQLESFAAKWDKLKGKIEDVALQIGESLLPHLERFVDWLDENWPEIQRKLEAFGGWLLRTAETATRAWGNMESIFKGSTDTIQGHQDVFEAGFTADWRGMWDGAKRIAGGALSVIDNAHHLAFGNMWTDFKSFVSSVPGRARRMWGDVRSSFTRGAESMVASVRRGGGRVIGFFRELPHRILAWLRGLPSQMRGIGMDMINGLVSGIRDMAASAVNAARGVVGDAINSAKSLLGISSPSKLFHWIGRMLGKGLSFGIDSQTGAVEQAVGRLANSVRTPMQKAKAEMLKHLRGGGSLFEDFSFRGMSGLGDRFNETIAEQFHGSGREFNRHNVEQFLRRGMPSAADLQQILHQAEREANQQLAQLTHASSAPARRSAQVHHTTVRVEVAAAPGSEGGLIREIVRALRFKVRTDSGGDANRFFRAGT